VFLTPAKILSGGETEVGVWKREQCAATIPSLFADLSEGSVSQIDVPDSIRKMQIAVFSKVDSALPDSFAPVVRGDFLRSFTVSSDLPDAGGEESVDVTIVSNGTSNISPVLLAELLVLTSIQVDLVDVIGAQCIALVANLDHHLGIPPGCIMHLVPFVGVLALANASSPISTDANGIALVGDCSDAVVPVSFSQTRVLAILEVESVQSVLVND